MGPTGKSRDIPALPRFPGSHPCISPDAQVFATETQLESFGGAKGEWGIVVGGSPRKRFRGRLSVSKHGGSDLMAAPAFPSSLQP